MQVSLLLSLGCSSKLSSWRGKLLSPAARVTQIQSVVGTMDSYSIRCFKLPQKSIHKLDALQMDYWWNKPRPQSIYFTSWKSVL